jgi:hypothetical protein
MKMSFDVEVEINGDGIKVSHKRIISLAMLCVRPGIDGIRRVAINETREGILWGIMELIQPAKLFRPFPQEIKTIDVRVIAEAHSEGDICKKGRIEFYPPLYFIRQIVNKELNDKVAALAESVTGGLIDSLSSYGTVLEYYEDGKVKIHLVTDVDKIPDKVTKNRRDYKKELEERIPLDKTRKGVRSTCL